MHIYVVIMLQFLPTLNRNVLQEILKQKNQLVTRTLLSNKNCQT